MIFKKRVGVHAVFSVGIFLLFLKIGCPIPLQIDNRICPLFYLCPFMRKKINEYGERLDIVIRHIGLTTSRFAHELGYAHPEILYQIKRGNNRISPHLAERIVARYPEIRKCWLLCGEGPMLHEKGGAENAQPAVTFYSTSTR